MRTSQHRTADQETGQTALNGLRSRCLGILCSGHEYAYEHLGGPPPTPSQRPALSNDITVLEATATDRHLPWALGRQDGPLLAGRNAEAEVGVIEGACVGSMFQPTIGSIKGAGK